MQRYNIWKCGLRLFIVIQEYSLILYKYALNSASFSTHPTFSYHKRRPRTTPKSSPIIGKDLTEKCRIRHFSDFIKENRTIKEPVWLNQVWIKDNWKKVEKQEKMFCNWKFWEFLINCVDFCHDSAKHASMMALAAPKVEKSWEKRWGIQLFRIFVNCGFRWYRFECYAGTDSSILSTWWQLGDYLMTTWWQLSPPNNKKNQQLHVAAGFINV